MHAAEKSALSPRSRDRAGALRPLRVIRRLAGLKKVVNSLFRSMPMVANVSQVCGLVTIVYALFGMPWLVLKVPLMYLLVLHVVPTGANRAGETVIKLSGSSRLRLRKARGQRSGSAKVAPSS